MTRPLQDSEVIDYDEKYAEVNIPAGSSGTEIVNIKTKTGKDGFLILLGNAVDAGGEDFVTFRVEVNRSRKYPFDGSLNQWGSPEDPTKLPVAIFIPQNSEVRVIAENSDGSNAYNATARIRIAYRDLPTLGVA